MTREQAIAILRDYLATPPETATPVLTALATLAIPEPYVSNAKASPATEMAHDGPYTTRKLEDGSFIVCGPGDPVDKYYWVSDANRAAELMNRGFAAAWLFAKPDPKPCQHDSSETFSGGGGRCNDCGAWIDQASVAENLKKEKGLGGRCSATPPPDEFSGAETKLEGEAPTPCGAGGVLISPGPAPEPGCHECEHTRRTRNAAQAECNQILDKFRATKADYDAMAAAVRSLADYLSRQGIDSMLAHHRLWADCTFGLAYSIRATIEHVRSKLAEIKNNPTDPMEWIDLLRLAMDGYRRAGGQHISADWWRKQRICEERSWIVTPGRHAEHVKE